MKKYSLILMIFFAANQSFSQHKPSVDEKIKISVKKYLSLTMNDYKSYESVKWEKAEKILDSFNENGMWDFLLKKIDSCNAIMKDYSNEVEKNLSEIKDNQERAKKSIPYYQKRYDSLATSEINENRVLSARKDSIKLVSQALKKYYDDKKKSFVPSRIKGYMVNHTFRGKNVFGALIIQNYTFILDNNLNVISANKSDSE